MNSKTSMKLFKLSAAVFAVCIGLLIVFSYLIPSETGKNAVGIVVFLSFAFIILDMFVFRKLRRREEKNSVPEKNGILAEMFGPETRCDYLGTCRPEVFAPDPVSSAEHGTADFRIRGNYGGRDFVYYYPLYLYNTYYSGRDRDKSARMYTLIGSYLTVDAPEAGGGTVLAYSKNFGALTQTDPTRHGWTPKTDARCGNLGLYVRDDTEDRASALKAAADFAVRTEKMASAGLDIKEFSVLVSEGRAGIAFREIPSAEDDFEKRMGLIRSFLCGSC